jgi:hypothetical protein
LRNPNYAHGSRTSPAPALVATLLCLICAFLGLAAGRSDAGWTDMRRPAAKPAQAQTPLEQAGTASERAAAPAVALAAPSEGVVSNLGLLESMTRSAVDEIAGSLRLPPGTPVTILSSTWHEADWFVGNMLAEVLAGRGYPVKVREIARPPDDAGGQQQAGAPGSGRAVPAVTPPEGHEETPEGTVPADTTGAYADSVAAATADPIWGTPPRTTEETPVVPPTQRESGAAPDAGVSVEGPRVTLPAGELLDVRVLEFGIGYSDARRVLLLGPLRFTRIGGVYLQVNHVTGPGGELHQSVMAQRHQVDHLSGKEKALAEGASFPFTAPELKTPSLGRYIEPTVVVAIVSSLVYLFYTNQN